MRRLWIAIVKLCGWHFALPPSGLRPEVMRCVFAVAPHTSVADFIVGIAYMWELGTPGHIFIKKEFFRWPLGGLLRRYGCVSIDRGNRRNGLVERAVECFAREREFSVVITPEGTRKPVHRWKRGYWEIATRAGVPVVPVYIDYARKEIGLFDTLQPTGDPEADTARLRSLFSREMARHPDQFVEIEK